jgi:hypothetical protein
MLAHEEAAAAKGPEILQMVMETPVCRGFNPAGGDFEDDGVDSAVLVGGRAVGQAAEELGDSEGDEEMVGIEEKELFGRGEFV